MGEINLNCGIYQIRNIITNVCYGGQSARLKIRPCEHWSKLKNNKHKNLYLQRSYNKHGKDNFVFEILIYCAPKDLVYYEQLFCDIDKAHGLSYNIRDCVDSNKGLHPSTETRKKISDAQKGENGHMYGKHLSQETRRKIGESLKRGNSYLRGKFGEDNPNFGRKNSPETINRMSEVKMGENNPNFGKHLSEETKEKLSIANSGKNNPMFGRKGKNHHMFGKHLSKETRRKMSISKSMPKETVLEVLKLLDKKITQTKISEKLHISQSAVSRAKNGFYNDIYDLEDNIKGE